MLFIRKTGLGVRITHMKTIVQSFWDFGWHWNCSFHDIESVTFNSNTNDLFQILWLKRFVKHSIYQGLQPTVWCSFSFHFITKKYLYLLWPSEIELAFTCIDQCNDWWSFEQILIFLKRQTCHQLRVQSWVNLQMIPNWNKLLKRPKRPSYEPWSFCPREGFRFVLEHLQSRPWQKIIIRKWKGQTHPKLSDNGFFIESLKGIYLEFFLWLIKKRDYTSRWG